MQSKHFTLYIPRLQHRGHVLQDIPACRRATDTRHGTVHNFACHVTEEGNLLTAQNMSAREVHFGGVGDRSFQGLGGDGRDSCGFLHLFQVDSACYVHRWSKNLAVRPLSLHNCSTAVFFSLLCFSACFFHVCCVQAQMGVASETCPCTRPKHTWDCLLNSVLACSSSSSATCDVCARHTMATCRGFSAQRTFHLALCTPTGSQAAMGWHWVEQPG